MGCEVINLGDGKTAIICGRPKDHVCNSSGIEYHISSSGEHIPDWKAPMHWSKAFIEWLEDNEIVGGCVSCSICKEPFSFPRF